MNLFNLISKVIPENEQVISLNSKSCLLYRSKKTICTRCQDLCPVDAIELKEKPIVNLDVCQSCLACIPLCPTGALLGVDSTASLITCLLRTQVEIIEIGCQQNAQLKYGVYSNSIGIKIQGCIASLGMGSLFSLSTMMKKRIIIRTDACSTCPWSSLEKTIEHQVQLTNSFIEEWTGGDPVEMAQKTKKSSKRQVWDTQHPPVSRRGLIRSMVQQGAAVAKQSLVIEENAAQYPINRDRVRLINALSNLDRPNRFSDQPVVGDQFALLSINDSCIGCGACARICPTKALTFIKDEEYLTCRLDFIPLMCVSCGLCTIVCRWNSIEIQNNPSSTDLFRINATNTIYQGNLKRCSKCNTLFAGPSDQTICPNCEFRKGNQFGSSTI